MNRLFAAIGLVVATAAPALANANDDVKNAMTVLIKASSYHMDIAGAHGMLASADVENPGRSHTYSPEAESIVVNGTMYMKMHGTWQKLPGNMGQMPSPADFTKSMAPNAFAATDLGPRLVGGVMLRAYNVTNTKKQSSTIYLDGSGRPVRIESDTTVIRISKFNAPMNIRAPL